MSTTVLALALVGLSAQAPDPVSEQHGIEARQHYRKGDEALHGERFAEAESEFRMAVRLDPLMTLAHYGLGQALMAQKQYREAVVAFQACRDAFQEIARIGMQDATLLDKHRTEEIQSLRESIAILQRNSRLASQNQTTVRRMEERVRELERMRQVGGSEYAVPAEVAFSLGSAWFRAGSLKDAEHEYLEALKANPRLGEAHSNLAVVYLMTNRIEDAWSELRAAEKAGYAVNPRLKQDIESRREPSRR